jgi:hypothetical protein
MEDTRYILDKSASIPHHILYSSVPLGVLHLVIIFRKEEERRGKSRVGVGLVDFLWLQRFLDDLDLF